MRHVVMFSGGVGSWMAAKRVAQKQGTADLTLLFTDTLIEDPDLYRFLDEAAANVGAELVRIAEGRTPWQVFHDRRFLGNNRADLCSETLKRKLADRWLQQHRDPADTVVYIGIDWSEIHRYTRLRERKLPWHYEAPLCDPPYIDKPDMLAALRQEGIRPPRLYDLGFAHNNCGGGCVKAGIGHWAHCYRAMPEVFAEWERQENLLREKLGDVAMLRDRKGGTSRPLPLSELRARLEAGEQCDMYDIGGCGCFSDVGEAA